MQRCYRCGLRSDTEGFFRSDRGGLFGTTKTVCEGCVANKATDADRRAFVGLIALSIFWIFPLIHAFDQRREDGITLAVALTAAFVSLPLRIMAHEAGHALMANSLGYQVIDVTIGKGPCLISFKRGEITIRLRRYIYAGGLVRYFDMKEQTTRFSDAAIVFAGPAADALCAVFSVWLSYQVSRIGTSAAQLVGAALSGIGLASGFMAIFNLIPQRSGDDGIVASDGRQLVQLLFGTRKMQADQRKLRRVRGLIEIGRFEDAAQIASSIPTS